MPQFVSTRAEGGASVSFEDALLEGLAPDGGLFVPATLPSVPPATQPSGKVAEEALRVLAPWLGDELPREVLQPLLDDALDFPMPLVSVGEGDAPTYVMELFHGPTLSFKDVGARVMARCMARFLRDRSEPLVLLVATSGDTGSAVADGFAGQPGIEVVLLHPKGQVSLVQERQLIVERPGVRSFAVEGTFDDCQRLVKGAFGHPALQSLLLSSANSINVGRLLPQMVYYFWGAQQAARRADAAHASEVVFCVPSGNLGNLTAGTLAARSGALPLRRFLAAHNANDFFPRFLGGHTGGFDDSRRTLSNAMDVGAPSNFERLRWLFSEDELRRRVWGASVTDEETLAAMRRVYDAAGYVADPHTAVGLEAVRRYRAKTGDDAPAVVLATAHPAKFPDVVEDALGTRPERPERLARLWEAPTRVEALPPALDAFAEQIRARHGS